MVHFHGPGNKANAFYRNGVHGDLYFVKQPDGRWQSSDMLPDEETTITLEKEGFTTKPQVVSLKEGEKRELVFVFKKNDTN